MAEPDQVVKLRSVERVVVIYERGEGPGPVRWFIEPEAGVIGIVDSWSHGRVCGRRGKHREQDQFSRAVLLWLLGWDSSGGQKLWESRSKMHENGCFGEHSEEFLRHELPEKFMERRDFGFTSPFLTPRPNSRHLRLFWVYNRLLMARKHIFFAVSDRFKNIRPFKVFHIWIKAIFYIIARQNWGGRMSTANIYRGEHRGFVA